MLNNVKKGTREIRLVWNNAQRVNHQNKLTHPHPKRNVVPTIVATKSGQVPVSPVKQSSPRAVTSISTASHVNTAAPKLKVNDALPKTYSYFKAHSSPKAVVSAAVGNGENAVKSLACWIWRPTGNVIDHTSKDSGSYMLKRFDYVDLQGRLNGYSRHMTGNKSFLIDYQEIDGGFVTFGGCPKEGKITGKVLLKVLRQKNMYNFDLKNVVPSEGLTCLFAKAIIDESNLWHRRLGHRNIKTINKLMRGNFVRGLPSKLFENDHTCVACQKGKQHKASCKTKLVFFLATKDETSRILKTFITGIENQMNYKVKVIRCDNGTEFKNNNMNQFCVLKGIKREFSVAKTPQQNRVAKRKNRTLIEAARTMLADSLLPTTFWVEAVSTARYVQNRVLVTKPHNKTPYELLHGRLPSISFMRPFGCPVTILNTLDPLRKFDEKADKGFFVGYFINSKAFRVFNTRTRKVEENLHINFLENKPNVARSGPYWIFDIDLLTNSMNYDPVTARNQTNKNAGIKDNVDAVPTQQYILLPLLYDSPKSSEDAVAYDAGKKTSEEPANEGERNDQEKKGRASNKEDDQNVQDFRAALGNLLVQQKEGFANSTNRDSTVSPSVSTAGQSFTNADDLPTDPLMPDLEDTADLLNTGIFSGAYDDEDVGAEADLNNLETIMNVSPIPITIIHKDHSKDQIIGDINSATQTRRMSKISEELAMVSYIKKQRRKNYKDYQNCLFACFLSQIEPKKVTQALIDPSWIEAMQDELLQFRLQKVWRLVDLPKGKHAIGTKWVYRNKKDKRGIVVRNKARLMDVKSAFLYGTIEKEVYVCQPPGCEDPQFPDKVYKVEKALYGLHQAPKAWYETLYTYLLENGFRRGTIDKTLFIKKGKGDILLVQVYVDDIIFGLQRSLYSCRRSGWNLHIQDKYVTAIMKKFDFSSSETTSTLIETNMAMLKGYRS
ncbi:putative ribonuclease H-like domain-containing protein [Tanacetum coccineum]